LLSTAAANTATNTRISFVEPNRVMTADVAAPGLCKAWVNFNGTGTVAIRAAFNVSSIQDNGTGSYTVNFSTAMPDANYSATVTSVLTSNYPILGTGTPGTGNFSIAIANQTAVAQAAADSSGVFVAVFR
jgi:hypothetical protein